MDKKALLAVSFGTSHEDTRIKTIDKIESALAAAFPNRRLYSAWTSGMIIKKLGGMGITVDTLPSALEKMKNDGVTDLLVQPTHVLNGVENDTMLRELKKYSNYFEKIACGAPLLTSEEDNAAVLKIFTDNFSEAASDTAVVLMGHGTEHYVNPAYAALDYRFKETGYANFFVATVESYPSIENVTALLKERKDIKNVILTPFMIVAGDHAKNDMAGDGEDSWKTRLENEGYSVKCVMKGLGEYDETAEIFVKHAKNAEALI